MNFVFELGTIVRDRVTGFEGAITGRAQHLTGCNTYGLQPKEMKDGKPIEAEWFDENRLEAIPKKKGFRDIYEKAHPEMIVEVGGRPLRAVAGGPQSAPKRTRNHP